MSVARTDARGNPIERIGVNYDVTEQKETERRLRLLVDELNHRVKNILTIVQSLAYQTFKGTPATEARRAFEGRLVTLANSHSYLANGEWEGVSLTALLHQAFTSQGIARPRVSLDGPAVSLRANQAFALALAFHELTTNALKYGALSTEAGRVEVRWRHDQALCIHWQEIGGPPVSKPTRQGFGSKLIEQALANDLRGHVAMKYEPTGVECSIEVPPSTSPLWE